MPKALVVYYSRSGNTRKMAEAVVEGLSSAKVETLLVDVTDATNDMLLAADGVVLGSPTYYGTMAAEMKDFLDKSVALHGRLEGKVGGAFATSGMLGGGNETTVLGLLQALLIHGMVIRGHARISHYGPIAITQPDAKALKECVAYGQSMGELVKTLAKS